MRHCTREMVAEVKSQLSYDESETLVAERSCGTSYSHTELNLQWSCDESEIVVEGRSCIQDTVLVQATMTIIIMLALITAVVKIECEKLVASVVMSFGYESGCS